MKTFLKWLISFFITGTEKQLNNDIEQIKDKLEKLDDKEYTDSERLDRLNKR